MKNLILLLFALIISCEPQSSYDYNASNIILHLREYKEEVHIPHLIIHKDSSFSVRAKCYVLMNDKRIYLTKEKVTSLLSKEEVKKLFEQIRQEYLREKKMNPTQPNKVDYNSKKPYYWEITVG